MARKYTRDNRGRFASGGGGATARGGRLKTAGGNKRATQTMRAQGAGGDGVIRGRTARTVAGQKVMGKLPKAAPKAVATAKGARVGGKMAKTSLPKPGTVAPMKGQDKAFQSLANLKKAEAFSSPKAPIKSVFLPREQMTRSRAEKVGLIDRNGLRRSSAESPRMRVTEMASGSRQGYVISPRSGVKANQARQRMAGTIAKPAGLKPRPAKPAAPAQAKAAPKAATPKAAPNAAKQRYKQASSAARAVGGDLRGASPMERRAANSKAAVVKNMERNRSTATASAANSPKAAQKARETARAKRAQSQFSAGMARESEGPGSKASRKVTVARRAMQIYSGKVDPKAKATARLTRTTDQYKLQDRIRRSAKLKPPKSPKPAAPAQAKAAKVAAYAQKSKMAAQRIDARKSVDLARFGFNGGAGDRAAANIPMSGTRGKRLDAEISRGVKAGRPVAASRGSRADAKPQAKPKQTRTAESLRMSRAKQIEKRRAIKIDNLPNATLAKRAQNSARTQAAAIAVYKGKPKAAKPATTAQAKAAPKTAKGKKADYAGAVALLSSQKAAINRLKQPMQTFNGNAAYGRNIDRLRAKSTPMANAQRDIKAALGAYRRTQSTKANEFASPEIKQRNRRELPGLRKKVVKAVRTARALKPEFAAETKRRFQARQAK